MHFAQQIIGLAVILWVCLSVCHHGNSLWGVQTWTPQALQPLVFLHWWKKSISIVILYCLTHTFSIFSVFSVYTVYIAGAWLWGGKFLRNWQFHHHLHFNVHVHMLNDIWPLINQIKISQSIKTIVFHPPNKPLILHYMYVFYTNICCMCHCCVCTCLHVKYTRRAYIKEYK